MPKDKRLNPIPDTTLTLRIPKGLHKLLTKLAKLEQRSLNQLITRMLQQGILNHDTSTSFNPNQYPKPETITVKIKKEEPEEEDVWPDLHRGER